MPKLPPRLRPDPLCISRSIGSKVVCEAYGELGSDCAVSSNSRFAGDEMTDSDVIRLEMTSGDAGWRWTRFGSGARWLEKGAGIVTRRAS